MYILNLIIEPVYQVSSKSEKKTFAVVLDRNWETETGRALKCG